MSGTLERRLATLEASLTPAERVGAWISGVDAAGGLVPYAEGSDGSGIAELVRGAASAERKRRGSSDSSVRRVVEEIVFRVELVLLLNQAVRRRVQRDEPVVLVLAASLRDSMAGPAEKFGKASSAVLGRAKQTRGDLLAVEEARRSSSRRYLCGRDCLTSDAGAMWSATLSATGQLMGSLNVGQARLARSRSLRAGMNEAKGGDDVYDVIVKAARRRALGAIQSISGIA